MDGPFIKLFQFRRTNTSRYCQFKGIHLSLNLAQPGIGLNQRPGVYIYTGKDARKYSSAYKHKYQIEPGFILHVATLLFAVLVFQDLITISSRGTKEFI